MAYPSKTSPEAIRAAAIDLIEREGEAALSIRGIASLLGVAPNALYRYYPSREALLAAVADEVARRLLAAVEGALDGPGGASLTARERVRTLMEVYAGFADAHPGLYRTLTTDRSAAEAMLPRPLGHDLLWRRVTETVAPLTGIERAPKAAVTLWSLLHGRWALRQAGLLGGKKPDDADGFAHEAVLNGLTA